VGKTTTALGLAAALPDRPLVVDADRDMPDLHALAGIDAARDDTAADPTERGQYVAEHDCRVLPAPPDDGRRTDRWLERVQNRGVAHGSPSTAPIVVDTPAGAGVDAARPLRAADGVVLVSTACAPAVRDAAKTASMARAVGTPVVGAVLTRTAIRPPNASDLFGCPVLAAVPESVGRPLDDPRVRERYDAAAARLESAVETFSPRDSCAERFSGRPE